MEGAGSAGKGSDVELEGTFGKGRCQDNEQGLMSGTCRRCVGFSSKVRQLLESWEQESDTIHDLSFSPRPCKAGTRSSVWQVSSDKG